MAQTQPDFSQEVATLLAACSAAATEEAQGLSLAHAIMAKAAQGGDPEAQAQMAATLLEQVTAQSATLPFHDQADAVERAVTWASMSADCCCDAGVYRHAQALLHRCGLLLDGGFKTLARADARQALERLEELADAGYELAGAAMGAASEKLTALGLADVHRDEET